MPRTQGTGLGEQLACFAKLLLLYMGGGFNQPWIKQPTFDLSYNFYVLRTPPPTPRKVYLFLKLKSCFFVSEIAFLP